MESNERSALLPEGAKAVEFIGTVQGAAARKYAGFSYIKPLLAHVDIWLLDPERLRPAHEYPRSINPPRPPNIRAVELADYAVKVFTEGNDGISKVQVWMQPNRYTAASNPLMVFEFAAKYPMTLRHECLDEILKHVFQSTAKPARWLGS